MKKPSSFELRPGEVRWVKRVVTPADAIRFIDAVGYCLLFPIGGLSLPSLYFACARRECTSWDRYCLLIWRWKDEFGRKRRAFYSKYFRGRGTFISLGMLPQFLAVELSAYGPDEYDRAYAAGRISMDARTVWRALTAHGPLATLELRHACRFDSTAGNRRFKKAMLQLSRLLLVVHSGAEQETGAWASSRFELTARAFPAAVARARGIDVREARRTLASKYLEWQSHADTRTIARLFGWSNSEAMAARNNGPRA
jgi:hypothetical protein